MVVHAVCITGPHHSQPVLCLVDDGLCGLSLRPDVCCATQPAFILAYQSIVAMVQDLFTNHREGYRLLPNIWPTLAEDLLPSLDLFIVAIVPVS